MSNAERAFSTIVELADAFDRRELSSREATELVLERIERLDARVNGYITVMGEEALADADRADYLLSTGTRSPLVGVPIAIKDLCETAGTRTTAGSRILADYIPEQDATVVSKLRAAGAVIVGKTHMAEFAYGYPHPDYGPSRTPWDLTRSASGSSGGSGAAVAAGLGWGAVGSDTGGSIRSPAVACGITGHKPTYGLVSRAGAIPLSYSLDHVGPMTRSSRDAMLMLEAMAGPDPRDPASSATGPWTAPAPITDAKGLRIGVASELFEGADPAIPASTEQALELLRSLGATTEEVMIPDLDLVNAISFGVMEPEVGSYHGTWIRTRAEDYAEQTRRGIEASLAMPATQYVDAQRLRRRFNAGVNSLYERFDVLLIPPDVGLASVIQEDRDEGHEQWDLRHTVIGNLTGMPSVVVPAGFSEGNLPVPIQFMTPVHADALALQVAELFQQHTDWHRRVPPGFGDE